MCDSWRVESKENAESKLFEIISLDKNHSLTIYAYGATITSWKCMGEERLLLSNSAILNGTKAIRGGIPIVFPQFGQPLSNMPQHGFARTNAWELVRSSVNDDGVEIALGLQHSDSTLMLWPHKFSLSYIIKITTKSLSTELNITNIDVTSFDCHSLLHTYIRIPHINNLSVTGFHNVTYIDKLKQSQSFIDTNEDQVVSAEIDRIYLNPTSTIQLYHHHHTNQVHSNDDITTVASTESATPISDVQSSQKSLLLEVSKSAILSHLNTTITTTTTTTPQDIISNVTPVPCDVVFWNAWIEKSKTLVDLDNDAYLNYICIEPGTVSNWVTVLPQQTLILSQILTVPDL